MVIGWLYKLDGAYELVRWFLRLEASYNEFVGWLVIKFLAVEVMWLNNGLLDV